MHFFNDANLDAETYLLLAICSQACRLKSDPRPTAQSYLTGFGEEIHATAHVFIWLGLATPDNNNPFGCRPTTLLMWIVARKPRRPLKAKKRCPSVDDEDAIDSIMYAALRREPFSASAQSFVQAVLATLGLVKVTEEDSEYVPTRLLLDIAASRGHRNAELEQHLRHAQVSANRGG
jgi:hypothetical protein